VRFGDAELARFAREGWPSCCGVVVQCFFAGATE
jgi:hypothetical protein